MLKKNGGLISPPFAPYISGEAMILSILYTQGLFQKLCIPISLRKAKINSQNRHSRFDSEIVYIKSTIDMENRPQISIFIYTISEIVLPCIVFLLNPSLKTKFHIHDFFKCLFVYTPIQM